MSDHISIGDRLYHQSNLRSAIASYCKALIVQPSDFVAAERLAKVLLKFGKFAKAFDWVKLARHLDPSAERLLILAADIAIAAGNPEAIDLSKSRIVFSPQLIGNWRKIVQANIALRCYSQALGYVQRLQLLDPEDVQTRLLVATVSIQVGRGQTVRHLLETLVCDAPLLSDAHYHKARMHAAVGEIGPAALCLQHAIAIVPNDPDYFLELSFCEFLTGDFDRAWRHYEQRLYCRSKDSPSLVGAGFLLSRFSSSGDIAQRRLFVWPDEGIGDEIKYGSMLGEFRGMVGKLLVQLDRRLIPLFRRSLPEDVEFFERGTVVPEDRYDSHIAIGSLGQYLRPTLESFAGKGGKYLWADPDRVQAMREWLSVREGERVIGLSWRSSNPETGAARSLALSDLVKSLQAPGVRFVNLQYGDVAAEIEALERDDGIEVLQCPGLDTTDDLDGLAALIEACDEVVSIGNATAHLAGALGKKTTVLLPKAPSWRWLAEGQRSLWYKSAQILTRP